MKNARGLTLLAATSVALTAFGTVAPAAEVTSASQRSVTLESGDARGVSLTLSGTGLDALSGGVVVNSRRRTEKGFSVEIGRGDAGKRGISISAPRQPPSKATYTLQLTAGRQRLDVSSRVLSIKVGGASSAPSGHPSTAGFNDCMPCHGDEPNKFEWAGRTIQPSDVSAYGLHQDAVMANVDQVVTGNRKLRSDGATCVSCHGATPHPDAAVKNFQSAGNEQMCSWVALFTSPSANKPQGLKNFFQNWKNRNCP